MMSRKENPYVREEKHTFPLRLSVLLLSAALLLAGILNGGALDVLAKAINICSECIGLG